MILSPLPAPPDFHGHPWFEVHLVLEGDGACEWAATKKTVGKRIALGRGDMVFIFPGEKHRFLPAGAGRFVQAFLGFSPGAEDGSIWKKFPPDRIRRRVLKPGPGALGMMRQVAWAWESGDGDRRRRAVFEWGATLSRWFEDGKAFPSPSHAHPLAVDLFTRLAAGIRSPWRIKDFAMEKGVDPSRLCRLFREAYGEGPSKVFQRMKLEAALAFLEEQRCTIARAADTFGYANAFHLSRQCRAFKGVSPKGWLGRG